MGASIAGGGGARSGAGTSAGPKTIGDTPIQLADGLSIQATSPLNDRIRGEEYDTIVFRYNGQWAGKMQYHVTTTRTSQTTRTRTAEIDDTTLSDAFRGRGTIAKMWPTFVRHMQALGVKKVIAKVVDQKVGTNVWGRVGFREYGKWDGQIGRWEFQVP